MGRRLFGSWMMASRRGRPVGCPWTYTTVAPISKELSARVVSTEIVRPRDFNSSELLQFVNNIPYFHFFM
jgi:hypothetical protein